MTTPDGPDLATRAGELLDDARMVEVAVDAAAVTLFRLGGDVARAGTRREAARSGAHLAAECDRVGGLLGELAVLTAAFHRLEAELDAQTGPAAAGGMGHRAGHDTAGGVDPRGEIAALLGSVRTVLASAGERGRECVWIGDLARDRVHDFAEFELLFSRASRHLDHSDPDAASADLARLVTLERALVSSEVAAMLDELRFRLLTERG